MGLFGIRRSPWSIARILWQKLKEVYAFGIAAELSYYFLFSIFPFLLFLIGLVGYLPVEGVVERFIAQVERFAPEQVSDLIRGNLRTLVASRPAGLLSVSVVVTLWAASNGFRALIRALNRAYGVRETRPLWRVYGLALGLVIASAIGIAVAVAFLVLGTELGHRLFHLLGVHEVFHLAVAVLRWPITALGLMLVFALVYWLLPNVRLPWKFITPGSVVGALLWVAAALGFRWYVGQFGRYSVTYGSLGGVIVLMIWLYLTGLLFVVGGTLNAMLQKMSPEGRHQLAGERRRVHAGDGEGGDARHDGPGGRPEREARPP